MHQEQLACNWDGILTALHWQVPYDRRLPFLFFGEETSMLARMWTRGFDVWAPPTAVAFHLWSRGYRHTLQKDTAPVSLCRIPTPFCQPMLFVV